MVVKEKPRQKKKLEIWLSHIIKIFLPSFKVPACVFFPGTTFCFCCCCYFECTFLLLKHLVFSQWHYPSLYFFPLGVLLRYFPQLEFFGVRSFDLQWGIQILEFWKFILFTTRTYTVLVPAYCCPIIPCFFSNVSVLFFC